MSLMLPDTQILRHFQVAYVTTDAHFSFVITCSYNKFYPHNLLLTFLFG
jgi:hypothetical protein